MGHWLRKLLGLGAVRDEACLVYLRREMQVMRLDLLERQEQIRRLGAELERLRAGEAARTQAATGSLLESLFLDLASPAAQLLAQAHILERGGELRAGDVALVGRQFVTALEDHGLIVLGRPGEETLFDESCHQPLRDTMITPGTRVTVRFPGFGFRGRVLRKALVQAAGSP